ncbi:hypothetical protein [Spirillospora sp. CA-294931]|uniref:hypothetical protein n=1 Tax=Spirillospora sp. CA-294931 TaxID=3240042 RepID=UPI003D8F4E27
MSGPNDPVARSVENAATVLDSYELRLVGPPTGLHRQDAARAKYLVRDLVRDLALYAKHRGHDFERILAEARTLSLPSEPQPDAAIEIGTGVRLRASARTSTPRSSLLNKRGFVTDIRTSPDGDHECRVRFLGVPAGSFQFRTSSLEPVPGIPVTPTRAGFVFNVADAARTLVTVGARILRDVQSKADPEPDDLAARRELGDLLAEWSGTTRNLVLFSLGPQISNAAFRMSGPSPFLPASEAAQVAAEDFPHDLANGVLASSSSRRPDTPSGRNPRTSTPNIRS